MPGDPRWTGPPEIIAATFEAGSSAAVVANNMVWVTETAHHEMAAGVSSANTAATLASWSGQGSGASAAAAGGLNGHLHSTAGYTAHKIAVTQGAAEAFNTAQSSVIPSVVSQSNRARREAMNQANPAVMGYFTPAIAQHDLEYYGQHWPHNSTIGMGYSTALGGFTAALGTVPPPLAPEAASPAAPAAAGEALSEAASSTGAQDGVSLSSQAAQAAGQAPASATSGATDQISSLLGPLQEAASGAFQPASQLLQAPTQGLQSMSSLPQSLMGAFSGMFSGASAPQSAEMASLAGPLSSGGGAAGIGGGAASAVGGMGAVSGAGLTSYTRPTSTFEPESGGRPMGLRTVAATSGPTMSGGGMGGMPMAPMAARGNGEESNQQGAVAHARIVVAGDHAEGE